MMGNAFPSLQLHGDPREGGDLHVSFSSPSSGDTPQRPEMQTTSF